MVKCWPCKRHFPTSVAAASLCLCSSCSSFQLRPFTQKKLSRLWNLSSMLHVGRIKIRSIYAQWLGQLAKSRRQQLRWLFGCAPLQWLHHLKAHWSFLPFPSMYSANPRLLVVLIDDNDRQPDLRDVFLHEIWSEHYVACRPHHDEPAGKFFAQMRKASFDQMWTQFER